MFDPLLQSALEYIDLHLLENPPLEEIAAQVGYSLSHFYALFQASTGYTLREYMRNRRLAMAARELVTTHRRVLDIAMDLGFESHEVFTRAFKALYGLSPNAYRHQRRDLLQYEDLDAFAAQMIARTPQPLAPVRIAARVIERGPIYLVGMEMVTSVAENIDQHVIEQFIQKTFLPRIAEITGRVEVNAMYGLEVSDPYTDRLTHFTAFEVQGPLEPPTGMQLRVLPRRSYAVFTPQHFLDPYAYSLLVRYAFGEWFPMSGRQFSGEFTMDVYTHGEALRLDVYVPLV
jgi:AraC family transcriptional regulator